MENRPNIDRRESRQAFEDKKLKAIDRVAGIIMLYRYGELTPNNINTLFTVTTGSLLEYGLVDRGRTYEEVDTGYKVTDLSISAFEAQERMFHKLGIDEMGDWLKKFKTDQELFDYMVDLSNQFETELMQVLEDKELING